MRLVQTQTQKLILSPQIRQYLHLLQLPLPQLETAIEQEMTENPVLEEVTKEPSEDLGLNSTSTENGTTDNERNTDELHFDETVRALDKLDNDMRENLYSQEDMSAPEAKTFNEYKEYRESLITHKDSLYDYLIWQLGFLDLPPSQQNIAEEIVGDITDDGYLDGSLEEIAKTCGVTVAEAEEVLLKLQSLDPPGIAARDLKETLLLQLERKSEKNDLATRIVSDYLPFLEKKQWEVIARVTHAAPDEIQKAAKVIAHLDPKPGRTFYAEDPIAVTPDATIYFDDEDGKLKIDVHDENLPEIRINPYYRRLLKDPKLDARSRKFLKEKIQAALDFVKALGQRRSTLRSITEEIVQAQTEFFEKGFSHLRPLRLKDISARLGIHESTVSRAIQEKYISTPQGTLPYKSFFSARLERTEGGAESQKSMMEKIREMIKQEDPEHVLSDQDITNIFRKDGIKIARRTVAKYRELLRILPSHLRNRK